MTHKRIRPGLNELVSFFQSDPGAPELTEMYTRPYGDAQTRHGQEQANRSDLVIIWDKAMLKDSKLQPCIAEEDGRRDHDRDRAPATERGLASNRAAHIQGAHKPIEDPGGPQKL